MRTQTVDNRGRARPHVGRWGTESIAYSHVAIHWKRRPRAMQRFKLDLAKAIRKDPELQKEYIRKLQDGEPVDELLLYANKPLRVRIVRGYKTWVNDRHDLHQEARVAMLEALLRYDTMCENGISPYGWLLIYVRSYLRRYLQDLGQIVRRPVHQYSDRQLVTGFVHRINLTPQAYLFSNMRKAFGSEGNETAFEETLVDEHTLAERELELEELRASMAEVVWVLTRPLEPREKMVVHRRLLREKSETLKAIGDRIGVTRERIRQIEAAAIERLQTIAAKRFGCPIEAYETFEMWCSAIVTAVQRKAV